MRFYIFTLGAFLTLAPASYSQQTQVVTDNQQIEVEVTTYPETCTVLLTGKERSSLHLANNTCTELAITNHSQEPITAWAAVTRRNLRGGGHQHFSSGARADDNLLTVNSMNAPLILPRDTHRVILGNPDRVEFKAAIFRGGSTFGDPAWIKRIIENRRQHYQDVAVAIATLRSACKNGTTAAALAQEFQALEQKEREEIKNRPNPADPLSLPLGGIDVFGTVEANLGPRQPGTSAARNECPDRALSMMMDLANKLLVSRPPIADHPVPLGEPLDTVIPPAAARPALPSPTSHTSPR